MIEFDIYREESQWFFDDPSKNIKHEEFVEGVPEMIQILCGNRKATRVHATIATKKPAFTEADELVFEYEEANGVVYSCHNLRCWFCPVFFEYFDKNRIPKSLWVKVEDTSEDSI